MSRVLQGAKDNFVYKNFARCQHVYSKLQYTYSSVMKVSETDRKIGENIRRIREQKGISKELYAQRLRKSTEYVTAVENGEKAIYLSELGDLAWGLKCLMSDIVQGI